MINVLWISRHEMTVDQICDLKRVLDDNVNIVAWKDTVKRIEDLGSQIDQADVIAVVLPPVLLSKLAQRAGNKKVLQSVSERIATGEIRQTSDGRTEEIYEFKHKNWQQILKFDLEVKDL